MLVPVLIVLFILAGSLLALADWIARGLLRPRRRPLTRTPRDYWLEYDEVAFRSTDGLTLRGWWMPAEAGAGPAPAVVLLHPLFGNRQGSAEPPARGLVLAQPKVDLLQAAAGCHQAGYAVLAFDFRGHGESEGGLCAGGLTEDQDVAGAVDYVFGRAAEAPRVGVMGFGLGAAAALAAVGRYKGGTEAMWVFSGDSEGGSDWTRTMPANVKRLNFLVLVEPRALGALVRDRLRQVVGPLGGPLAALVSGCAQRRGGYPLDPTALRKFAGGVTVPVLYVQSRADPGAGGDVQGLYDATPAPKQILRLEAAPGAGVDAQLERLLDFAERAGQPA